jgi:gluconokinase
MLICGEHEKRPTRHSDAERLAARRARFMPPSLLDSQFATLDPPGPDERPIAVAIELSPEEIINRISGVLLSSDAPGNPA